MILSNMPTNLKFSFFASTCVVIFCLSRSEIVTKGTFFIEDAKDYSASPKRASCASKEKVSSASNFHTCSMNNHCTAVNRKIKSSQNRSSTIRWKKMLNEKSLRHFKDCESLYEWGNRKSGTYMIWPNGAASRNLTIFCNMDVYTGGWMTIQRRVDEDEFFNRNWKEYKDGFGALHKSMWIGLENIKFLTSVKERTLLQIDILFEEAAHTFKATARYGDFKVQSEADGYRLHVGQFTGNVADAMTTQNGQQFSTTDKDQDGCSCSCSSLYTGGWWFGNCTGGPSANLNGVYAEEGTDMTQAITWGKHETRKVIHTEMRIKYNNS